MEERRWRVGGARATWRRRAKAEKVRGAKGSSRGEQEEVCQRPMTAEGSGAEFGAAVTGRRGCANSVRRTGGRRKGGEQVDEAVASGKAICGERSGSLKRRLC